MAAKRRLQFVTKCEYVTRAQNKIDEVTNAGERHRPLQLHWLAFIIQVMLRERIA